MDILHIGVLIGGAIITFLTVRAWHVRASAPGTMAATALWMAGFVTLGFVMTDDIGPLWYVLCLIALIAGGVIAVRSAPKHHDPVITGDGLETIHEASNIRDEGRDAIKRFGKGRLGMGMVARFVDSFVVSPDERVRDVAVRRIAVAQEHLDAVLTPWTLKRAEELIQERPEAAALADATHRAHVPHRIRIEAAERLLLLGRRAEQDLRNAISSLDSARSMEMLDAVSSNKGISALSTSATSSASSAVRRAQESIHRLSTEAGALSHALPHVSDGFDFVLDMTIDLPLDFMSWINMGRLSTAIDRCRAALAEIERDVARLDALHRRELTDGAPTLADWRRATDPFVAAAIAELPPTVRAEGPTGLPLRPMS